MAADQERADRIRALKAERPDLTWRRIGDAVGVSERSAFEWGKKGGIDYEHAKRLAEVFEVDIDYIWRGATTHTPDLFGNGGQPDTAQLDRIEAFLLAVLERLDMDPDEALRNQLVRLGRFAAREELAGADAPASVPARTGHSRRVAR